MMSSIETYEMEKRAYLDNLSTYDKRLIAFNLVDISFRAIKGDYSLTVGLCNELCMNSYKFSLSDGRSADMVTYCSFNWPGFSGDDSYPIGKGEREYNRQYSNHERVATFWKGEQLEQRLSLMSHLLRVIETELDLD